MSSSRSPCPRRNLWHRALKLPGCKNAAGTRVQVHFISASPRTDPRIQGMSFFYLARAQPGVLAGMAVVAHLPAGPEVSGFIIPSSAVIWREGKAWVFEEVESDRFTRRPVPTQNPVEKGYFAARGFRAGERVVIQGAQVLLAAEFQPSTARKEDED